jgi:alpha-D-ribose 1-methylphosphonate 5-triphosphate synthase subunit PhnH
VTATALTDLRPGFLHPVEAAQETFRAILEAMARPGRIQPVAAELSPPGPLDPATAAAALTLFDFDTPVWTDLPGDSAAVQWCRFHTGVPLVEDPAGASFALITRPESMPDLDRFHTGTDQRPDTGATLVVQVPRLDGGPVRRLRGPGIPDATTLSPDGLPESVWAVRLRMTRDFPLGVDLLFTHGRRLAGLPRSTRLD